jgi:tRNA(fMet)-specific endonuclease VapC
LDTNVCVELIRKRSERVLSRLWACSPGSVGISSITLGELSYGVARSAFPERNLIALAQFCTPLEVLPFGNDAAAVYGRVRAQVERSGLDTLIAAHALSEKVTLVTDNGREFRRVAGLDVENWTRP